MSSTVRTNDLLRQKVIDCRRRLESGRQQLLARFRGGATGMQIAGSISELVNQLVVELFVDELAFLSPEEQQEIERNSALLAIGGTGRGDLAPYSDADLLFVYSSKIERSFQRFSSIVVRHYWDAGLKLGHSVRTVGDSLSFAKQEPQFATSLLESRLLWGSESLAQDLQARFMQRLSGGRRRDFVAMCVEARQKERVTHGATVQELEPDVKRSQGGLRDYHLIRWIGFAEHGTGEIDLLRLQGVISKEESRKLLAAYEFLLGVRIDLHFQAGKPQDTLSREDQVRIADTRQIEKTSGQLPVERFMQEYFQHSTVIADLAQRLSSQSRIQTWSYRLKQFLTTNRIDRIYRLGTDEIDIAPRFRTGALSTLPGILQLFSAAAAYRVNVAADLCEQVKQRLKDDPPAVDARSIELFLDILNRPGRLGQTLRTMYRVGVLELLLPQFRHIRCLLQFNQYHSYTVDEHTLRTIEAIEEFNNHPGTLGHAYRAIRQKSLLHLALLLHDAGKGYEEDHSDVGKRLADDVATLYNLNEHDRELLVFLVYKHLNMAHLAFRRDVSDPDVLHRFAHDVGSAEALRMLFTLTAADISAVGPGVWNEWKGELLSSFFENTMLALTGKVEHHAEIERVATIREKVMELATPFAVLNEPNEEASPISRILKTLPPHYLLATAAERIAVDTRVILTRQPNDIFVEAMFDGETNSVEYRILTSEQIAPGCFHKIAGALTAKRMEILSAQICTTGDGIIIDSFRVLDGDHEGAVPRFRLDEVCEAIKKVLAGELSVEQMLAAPTRFVPRKRSSPVIVTNRLPSRVVIDQESSDRCTVLDIFADDRPGLLYALSRILFQSQISVVLAKISTHLDQVVDVFYITDRAGKKIVDPDLLKRVRRELLLEVDPPLEPASAG